MKKEFSPGDYCRFPNEQIPHILDILKANGHKVKHFPDVSDCSYIVFQDGELIPNQEMDEIELTPHDFMTIGLRLEEGMGMRSNTSTPEQRAHISSEMEKIGIKIGMSIKLYSAERNTIILLKDELSVCSNRVPADISYTELCRRLCVEPIGTIKESLTVGSGHVGGQTPLSPADFDQTEKNLEQHVDEYDATVSESIYPLTIVADRYNGAYSGGLFLALNVDPWDVPEEIGGGDSTEMNFFDEKGAHTEYKIGRGRTVNDAVADLYCRMNEKPEFNASMLEVGEWMVVEDEGPYNGCVLKKMWGEHLACMDTNELISTGHEWLKGRKVQVEIKIVEP